MSLSTELTRMAQNVGVLTADTKAIFEALRAKGVNVPANAQLSDVADMIETIEVPPPSSVKIGDRYYHYIQIGNQLWIDENLNWKFPYNGGTVPIGTVDMPTTPAAWYREDNETQYGYIGLYYNHYCIPIINSLLPDGWRVPTKSDLDNLITIPPEDLCSTSLGGTNNSGFNAIGSGYVGNIRQVSGGGYEIYKSFASGLTYTWIQSSTQAGQSVGLDIKYILLIRIAEVRSLTQYNQFGVVIRLVKDLT